MSVDPQHLRIVEAVLFAAAEPLDEATLTVRLPDDADVAAALAELAAHYTGRGVQLVQVAGKWAFRTAVDLAPHMRIEAEVPRRLSRAATETLAIIAYHQPITRAEIEEIRGVSASRGTLDLLLETRWIRPGRRRRTPGRPVTWLTTEAFLGHFGLESLDDLPGVEELRASGLLDARPDIAPALVAVGDETADAASEEAASEEETEIEPLSPDET
jgi:segregation and condensation protein B